MIVDAVLNMIVDAVLNKLQLKKANHSVIVDFK